MKVPMNQTVPIRHPPKSKTSQTGTLSTEELGTQGIGSLNHTTPSRPQSSTQKSQKSRTKQWAK